MKNRILLVTSEFPPLPGGIGNHACNLAKTLNKQGYIVTVLADQRSSINDQEEKFDNSFNFKIVRIKLKSFRPWMYFERIFNVFKLGRKNDIILASGKFSLWQVALLSFFYKKKYIAIIHGTEVNLESNLSRKAIDFSLKRFKKLIAVSHYSRNLLKKDLLNKTVVIPNGYDSEIWKSTSSTNNNFSKSLSLVTVGNVNERKGQHSVIKMLSALKEFYPNLHYHCIGVPTLKKKFSKLAEELGVEKHVTMHGVLKHQELMAMVKNCDLVVMLSTPSKVGDVEGFGIAIIEANALGLPAIGSKNCGIEDAIKDHYSGILIDSMNTEEFIKAVQNILSDYPSFSANSIEWANLHQWDSIVKHYIRVIEG